MHKLRLFSLAGVACSSLCFLALPLIALWVPASSWLHNERLTRAMLLMFLAMALFGGYSAFRHHGRAGPGACALAGSAILIVVAWNGLAGPAGWLGLALLFAAWLWDWRLMRRLSNDSC
jgi:hypothetical protein